MEKYGRHRQATDGNIIWRMRIACWITKATQARSEYVIFTALPRHILKFIIILPVLYLVIFALIYKVLLLLYSLFFFTSELRGHV